MQVKLGRRLCGAAMACGLMAAGPVMAGGSGMPFFCSRIMCNSVAGLALTAMSAMGRDRTVA